MAVTNDWYPLGSIMANEFASQHPELVSSVALYNDSTFVKVTGSVAGGLKDTDGTTIAPPKGAVHYMNVASGNLSGAANICGRTPARVLNTDDIVAYWAKANKPTGFSYGDVGGSNQKFCTGTFSASSGMGVPTTLEKLVASSTATGKDIVVYKLVGNARGTPLCSFNFQGKSDPTICDSTNPAVDFRAPPATCTWTHPCNHFLAAPDNHLLGALYNFMTSHKMP
jgi:hypothetical protein